MQRESGNTIKIGKVEGDINGDIVGGNKTTTTTFMGTDTHNLNDNISKLIKLVESSNVLSDKDKKQTTEALKSIPGDVEKSKGNEQGIERTLKAIQDVVKTANDIAGPAVSTISMIAKLLGFAL